MPGAVDATPGWRADPTNGTARYDPSTLVSEVGCTSGPGDLLWSRCCSWPLRARASGAPSADTLPPIPEPAVDATEPGADEQSDQEARPAPPAPEPRSIPALPRSPRYLSGVSGNVLIGADGVLEVAVAAPDGGRASQPTWNPDGTLLAYSLVEQTGAWVVVIGADRAELARIESPFAPFYLSWSPDGSKVGALGSSAGGVAFGVADVDGEGFTNLGAGTHYFYDWAPSSEIVASHEGPRRLATLSLTGEDALLSETAGAFQAPEWTPDGSAVIIGVAEAPPAEDVTASGGIRSDGYAQPNPSEQRIVQIDIGSAR